MRPLNLLKQPCQFQKFLGYSSILPQRQFKQQESINAKYHEHFTV